VFAGPQTAIRTGALQAQLCVGRIHFVPAHHPRMQPTGRSTLPPNTAISCISLPAAPSKRSWPIRKARYMLLVLGPAQLSARTNRSPCSPANIPVWWREINASSWQESRPGSCIPDPKQLGFTDRSTPGNPHFGSRDGHLHELRASTASSPARSPIASTA
jgi:hypothetical protein